MKRGRDGRRRAAAAVALALLLYPPQPSRAAAVPADPTGEQGMLCRRAMQQAEIGSGLPQNLLAAIARVESGRLDPVTGRMHPWPWTVDAEGQGSFFASKAEAIAYVRQLQARGVQSIDVGCLQINLMNHPDAFHSLDEAFDPDANARYAVRFLNQLRAKTGSWDAAAAWYHSATPGLGLEYRAKVMAALAAEANDQDGSSAAPHAGWPVVAASLSGLLAGHARIIMLPPASSGIMPARAGALAAARTGLAGGALMGLGQGAASGAAMELPRGPANGQTGRTLASYRMRPVLLARPSVMPRPQQTFFPANQAASHDIPVAAAPPGGRDMVSSSNQRSPL